MLLLNSDPTKEDSDDDGLLDGKRQLYNGRVMLPKDADPFYYNGPHGIWDKQKEMVETENIQTEYSDKYIINQDIERIIVPYADPIVDTLLQKPNVVNKLFIGYMKYEFKRYSDIPGVDNVGAYILNFIHDKDNVA